jgi:hypothetical protein
VELWERWELLMSEPRLNDPISEEPEYWRCAGCNEYFHPEKYDWHVDEECPGPLGASEGESNE